MWDAITEYEKNRIIFSAAIGFLCRRFGRDHVREYLYEMVNAPEFWNSLKSIEEIDDKLVLKAGRELFSSDKP